MKYKAVIFDLDGVIVSTDQLHYRAWKKMADMEGIYFDQEINHQLRGVSRADSLEIILKKATKKYTQDEKLKLMTFKNDIYVKSLSELTPEDILPNINYVLDELIKRDIKIAIGSSSRNAGLILKQLKLENKFDAISDGNDITYSKPHPEVFLIAANKLNIDPKDCIVVEDAQAGIEAAKAANMFAFAIGDAKESNLSDYKSDDIKDLLKFV